MSNLSTFYPVGTESSGGGGLDWSTPVQTTDFVAEAGKGYHIDTSSGPVTMTLPATPNSDMQVGVKDYNQNFHHYNAFINSNSSLIEGSSELFRLDSRGYASIMTYTDAIRGWLLISSTPIDFVSTKPFMHVRDVKGNSEAGGACSVGMNTKRTLNTTVANDIPGASLTSNVINLPAGTYYIEGQAPAAHVNNHKAFLVNDATDTVVMVGSSEYVAQQTYVHCNSWSKMLGVVVLTEPTTLRVDHWTQETYVSGFGIGATDSYGADNYFTELRIWKLDSDIKTYTVSDPEMYLKKPLMQIEHKESSGLYTLLNGIRNLDISNVITNEVSGASLSNNVITLPAGLYTFGITLASSTDPTVAASFTSLWLENTDGTDLTDKYNVDGYGGGTSTISLRLELLNETTFTVKINQHISDVSVYVSTLAVINQVMIWQEDAVVEAPVTHQPVNQPVVGAEVTGGVFGGELVYVDDTNVNINPVSCMDDTLEQALAIASTTTVTLSSPSINTIYNFFAVRYNDDTYGIEYDTDVNGANLVATVTHKRWVGFVLTDASGNIARFKMSGSNYTFLNYSTSTFGSGLSSTSFVSVDVSAIVPTSRVHGITVGSHGSTNTAVSLSEDGGITVATSLSITSVAALTDSERNVWGSGWANGVFMSVDNMQSKVVAGTYSLAVHNVTLKR